jgi:hypothetical protein
LKSKAPREGSLEQFQNLTHRERASERKSEGKGVGVGGWGRERERARALERARASAKVLSSSRTVEGHACISARNPRMYVYMYTYIHLCMYTHTHTYASKHAGIHIVTYVYTMCEFHVRHIRVHNVYIPHTSNTCAQRVHLGSTYLCMHACMHPYPPYPPLSLFPSLTPNLNLKS